MKNTLLLFGTLVLLAAAGCSQSNSADNSSSDTNTVTQNAEQSASNAWQDTKNVASNAVNGAESGATNAWNKTTNAVNGGN